MKITSIILCVLFLSCKKKETKVVTYIVNRGLITDIESLNDIKLGGSDTILVSFSGGSNTCYRPYRLETILLKGDTISIKAFYIHKKDEQGFCGDMFPEHKMFFFFKPASAGTYTYKANESNIYSKTIVH